MKEAMDGKMAALQIFLSRALQQWAPEFTASLLEWQSSQTEALGIGFHKPERTRPGSNFPA